MGKKKNNKNIFDDFGIKATFDGSAVILNSNDFPQQGNKGCSENSWGTARFAEGNEFTGGWKDNEDDEFTEDWEDNEDFKFTEDDEDFEDNEDDEFTEDWEDNEDFKFTEDDEDFEDDEFTEDDEDFEDDEFTEDWKDNEGFDTDNWLDFDNSVSNNPGVSHQEPFPGDLGFQPAYDTPWLSFGDNTDNNQIDCYDIQEYIIDHGFYLDNTNKVIYLLDLPHVYKDMILTRTNKENKGYKVVFCVLDVFDIAAVKGTDMYLSFKEVPQVQSLIQGYIDAFMVLKEYKRY